MAASEIKDLFNGNSTYATNSDFTITLASLASSTVGVGRQTTMIDNTTTRYSLVYVFGKIKQGTSPTGSKAIYLYAIRGDKNGTAWRTDGAGASDAGLTRLSSPLLSDTGVGRNASSPATGDFIYPEGWIVNPGPEFGVCLVHDTGVALDATGGNHYLRWIGFNPQAQ